MTSIAVIGTGKIGGTLARKWAAAGHDVTLGARDPSKAAALAAEIGARAASVEEAVAAGDVVLFAVPGAAMASTLEAVGASLDGKVAIDAANNIQEATNDNTAAFAEHAPGAAHVRAFNTLGWELFDDPTVDGVQVDLFFCGPDGSPRSTVESLIADVGLRPVWVGGPEEVQVVDAMLRLWITLVRKRGFGRRLAFKMIQD
jgi:predicted dinucleotide-binding enzyme